MKTFIVALSVLALAACGTEPTPASTDNPAETPAAKARTVSLNISGMT